MRTARTETKRVRNQIVAVVMTGAVMLLLPLQAEAQRRGGIHAAGRGRGSFRAGRSLGRHEGYHAGMHRGFRAGAHMGAHAGFHAGLHAHPWARRRPMFWPWHPIGFFVAAIATTAIVVAIVDSSGQPQSSGNVYYDQGVYYEQTSAGYNVIPPPTGAQIPSLPDGYTAVTVGGQPYSYYQGDFYVESNGQYVVAKAPAGAIVPYVPDSATETDSNGNKFYDYNGVRYQAVSVSGDTSYLVTG